MGELVEFAGARGYLATGEGAGLGVIVIQEWWGLVPHIEDVCERFAAEGFTALAPDLYHGKAIPNREPDEAEITMMGLDMPRAARDLTAAVDFLVEHPAVRGHGVGVVGFCMGGGLALWLASLRPDQVKAVVPFYGFFPWEEAKPAWDKVLAPVEGHYAAEDQLASPAVAADIAHELESRGREVRMFVYPGVDHAFYNDTRPDVFNEDAARQAWVRTLEFLRAKLG